MTIERKKEVALILIKRKVQITLNEPNTAESKRIAKSVAPKTGIGHLEIHRFHNAIINNNLERSFEPSRASDIALALIRAVIEEEGRLPDTKFRGQMSGFANEVGLSFNELLEFCREIYIEIVNDVLRPQSQA